MRKSGSFVRSGGQLTLLHRTGPARAAEVPAAKFPTPATSGATKSRRKVVVKGRAGIQTTDQRSNESHE